MAGVTWHLPTLNTLPSPLRARAVGRRGAPRLLACLRAAAELRAASEGHVAAAHRPPRIRADGACDTVPESSTMSCTRTRTGISGTAASIPPHRLRRGLASRGLPPRPRQKSPSRSDPQCDGPRGRCVICARVAATNTSRQTRLAFSWRRCPRAMISECGGLRGGGSRMAFPSAYRVAMLLQRGVLCTHAHRPHQAPLPAASPSREG